MEGVEMEKLKSTDINYESEISRALSTPGYVKLYPMMTVAEAKKAFDKFVNMQKQLPDYLRPKV